MNRQRELWEIAAGPQLKTKEIPMGPLTSYSLLNDPKHMVFVLSRYKFCSKILSGKKEILEIGCGDGFGTPIVAKECEKLLAIDNEPKLIESNIKRLSIIDNIEFKYHDFCKERLNRKFDGIFSIDVLEHFEPHSEDIFMKHTYESLNDDGICIIGTPNINASEYATERSRIHHINLKNHISLKKLMRKYFENVIIFSMNDEVVCTGYEHMAHYLFGIGIGKKK